jgi:hypothetical protein
MFLVRILHGSLPADADDHVLSTSTLSNTS